MRERRDESEKDGEVRKMREREIEGMVMRQITRQER